MIKRTYQVSTRVQVYKQPAKMFDHYRIMYKCFYISCIVSLLLILLVFGLNCITTFAVCLAPTFQLESHHTTSTLIVSILSASLKTSTDSHFRHLFAWACTVSPPNPLPIILSRLRFSCSAHYSTTSAAPSSNLGTIVPSVS